MILFSGGSGALAQAKALSASEIARFKSYEGDPCGDCGQFTMVRNGTCLKCITWGQVTKNWRGNGGAQP